MGTSVLLAEDDPITREVIEAHLRALGCSVRSTASVAGAIALGNAQDFDALLLDCKLSDGSALMVLHTLRGMGGMNANTPAIAMSAELDDARVETLISAGFADAMEKPMRRERLRYALASCNIALPIGANIEAVSATTSEPLLPLDDHAGLQACGSIDVLHGLRTLLVKELPIYLQEIHQASAHADAQAMHACVHRMKSALGFCGATKLKFLLDQSTTELPSQEHLRTWQQAIEELNEVLRAPR